MQSVTATGICSRTINRRACDSRVTLQCIKDALNRLAVTVRLSHHRRNQSLKVRPMPESLLTPRATDHAVAVPEILCVSDSERSHRQRGHLADL
ncbi:hypothetical protein LBMAG56_51140 [Verrucomicrobiota bacterium]|nr:hypothetical protein LBMAG56_51140 [Verrucomicrobiota bacterium]